MRTSLLGALLLAACGLLEPLGDPPPNDGSECSEDADCSTEHCTTASLCSHTLCRCTTDACPAEGQAVDDCQDGWVCVDADRLTDPIVDFFGGTPRQNEGYCQPTCEAGCPEHYVCSDGTFCGPDTTWAAPGAVLSWTGPVEGSHIGMDPPGRAELERGASLQVRGMGESPVGAAITEVRWQVVDSSGLRTEPEGPAITVDIPGDASFVRVELTVLDDRGRAGITHVVFETCSGTGEACGYQGSGCCGGCDDAVDLCL